MTKWMRLIAYYKFIKNIIKYIVTGYGILTQRFYVYFTHNSHMYIRVDVRALYNICNRNPDSKYFDSIYQLFQKSIKHQVRSEYAKLDLQEIDESNKNPATYADSLKIHGKTPQSVNEINAKLLANAKKRRL